MGIMKSVNQEMLRKYGSIRKDKVPDYVLRYQGFSEKQIKKIKGKEYEETVI